MNRGDDMKKILMGVAIFILLIGGLYYLDNVIFDKIAVEENQEDPNEGVPIYSQGSGEESQRKIGIRSGNIAADFTLPNLENKAESLWDYRGKKVILNFWSSDCLPCREEMLDINEYYIENKENNVVALAVNLGQSPEVAKDFINQNKCQFPVLVDPNSSVAYAYGVVYMPTTYFINEEGVIENIHIGILTKEDIDKYLK